MIPHAVSHRIRLHKPSTQSTEARVSDCQGEGLIKSLPRAAPAAPDRLRVVLHSIPDPAAADGKRNKRVLERRLASKNVDRGPMVPGERCDNAVGEVEVGVSGVRYPERTAV